MPGTFAHGDIIGFNFGMGLAIIHVAPAHHVLAHGVQGHVGAEHARFGPSCRAGVVSRSI
jgi:hypothetical protein